MKAKRSGKFVLKQVRTASNGVRACVDKADTNCAAFMSWQFREAALYATGTWPTFPKPRPCRTVSMLARLATQRQSRFLSWSVRNPSFGP